jgi:hypothetical protein
MSSIGTRAFDMRDTKLWRSSRGAQSSGFKPARPVATRRARATLRASSGVPSRVVNTSPCSCHLSPAFVRNSVCTAWWVRRASTHRRGSLMLRRGFTVLVSPVARTDLQTLKCGGTGGTASSSPFSSTGVHSNARTSSVRMPLSRDTTRNPRRRRLVRAARARGEDLTGPDGLLKLLTHTVLDT